jgi:hypothetical protein
MSGVISRMRPWEDKQDQWKQQCKKIMVLKFQEAVVI